MVFNVERMDYGDIQMDSSYRDEVIFRGNEGGLHVKIGEKIVVANFDRVVIGTLDGKSDDGFGIVINGTYMPIGPNVTHYVGILH